MLITDKSNTYRIKVLRPEAVITVEESGNTPLLRFQGLWQRHEDKFDHPRHHWSGEDYRIAQSLVKKFDYAKLDEYLEKFWFYHAEPITGHGYDHPLRLFAAGVPLYDKDL